MIHHLKFTSYFLSNRFFFFLEEVRVAQFQVYQGAQKQLGKVYLYYFRDDLPIFI